MIPLCRVGISREPLKNSTMRINFDLPSLSGLLRLRQYVGVQSDGLDETSKSATKAMDQPPPHGIRALCHARCTQQHPLAEDKRGRRSMSYRSKRRTPPPLKYVSEHTRNPEGSNVALSMGEGFKSRPQGSRDPARDRGFVGSYP